MRTFALGEVEETKPALREQPLERGKLEDGAGRELREVRAVAEPGIDERVALDREAQVACGLSVEVEHEGAQPIVGSRMAQGCMFLGAFWQSGVEESALIRRARQRQSIGEKGIKAVRTAEFAQVEFAAVRFGELAQLAPQSRTRLAREARHVIREIAVHRDVVAAIAVHRPGDQARRARHHVGNRFGRGR